MAKILEEQAWSPMYLDQPDFIKFLDKTNEEYATILEEIGMLAK